MYARDFTPGVDSALVQQITETNLQRSSESKLTRMASMWDAGNGGNNDVVMVNIAPKTDRWNSLESLNKSSTGEVGGPTAVNNIILLFFLQLSLH